MRSRSEVTAEKLRGGFYTPDSLVAHCYERLAALAPDAQGLSLLEPSVGDGAFLRGLRRSPLAERVERIDAVEIDEREAAKARAAHPGASVHAGSVLPWATARDTTDYDLLVGNPPFVRYQFVSAADKAAGARLGEALGVVIAGVANAWIPVVLAGLHRLRVGGAFALVVPAECFTGSSAAVVREQLGRTVEELRFDLFPPRSFPGVLQEVFVLSGRKVDRRDRERTVTVVEHSRAAGPRRWGYRIVAGSSPWTRYLLEPRQLAAIDELDTLDGVSPLGRVARIEVSNVTGANGFFCVDDATVQRLDLRAWARPLLARARHAPGLLYGAEDERSARATGARCWLLDFGPGAPDPAGHAGARRYLAEGEVAGLPERYKCRIREPWYRVPTPRRGSLLLSKRSHLYPRLVVNAAGAYTTDTIYRGRPLPGADVSERDLVVAFHGSLTLATVELEGRSFGGGVLELVPSEIARLRVAASPGLGARLPELDVAARSGDPDALVAATDDVLVEAGVLTRELAETLAGAREALAARRLARNHTLPSPVADAA